MALGSDADAELLGLRDEVVALWERETARLWAARTDLIEEVRPRTDRSRTVFLSLWPITTITLVEEKWDAPGSSYATTAATSYTTFGDHGIENLAGWWQPFVRVKYTGGYADGAAPLDVQRALIVQAKFMRARFADEGKLISRRQSFGQWSGTGEYEEATLHPYFGKLAKTYRRKT